MPGRSYELLFALFLFAKRIELRRSSRDVNAIRTAIGYAMGESLELCWFEALSDSPEEAKALHALHENKMEWLNKQAKSALQPSELE